MHRTLAFIFAGLFASGPLAAEDQPTDARIAARSQALEVAGAFSNDDFILRDGHQWGTLEKEKPAVIQVNLFAGNHYWFVASTSPRNGSPTISVYGEDGKALPYEPYQSEGSAAAGFSPRVSGPYYIRITGAGDYCFLYSYK